MSSPTSLTLEACRARGWRADVAERWVPKTRTRRDLFGFIDVVALDLDAGQIVGIQATDGSNHAKRLKKITTDRRDEAIDWLKAGGRIEVWSWRRVKVKRGGKAIRWRPRIQVVTLADLDAQAAP